MSCDQALGGCSSATVDIYGQAHACDKINGHSGNHACSCAQRWSS